MTPESPFEPRDRTDRRRRPTNPWDAFRPRGQRLRPRRVDEQQAPHFVDLIDTPAFVFAVLLLVLTVVDGAVTLILLGAGCEEVNPAMGYLLNRGPTHFLLGKYLLTTAGLPFLVIFRHFPLFGTRLRVGHLLPTFVALYLALLAYQIALIHATVPPFRPEADTSRSSRPLDNGDRTSTAVPLSNFPSPPLARPAGGDA